LTPTGLESISKTTGKTVSRKSGGAESGAFSADSSKIDPDLARIVAAWPTLAEPIKRAILALVNG
jgi:hypothetical protein